MPDRAYDRGVIPPDGPGRYSTVSAEDGDLTIAEVNDLIPDGIANADYIAAMHPDTAKKLIAVAEALELVIDCSSQEWQQANGKRMAATDNQGRRFWFITEDVMQAARTALEELK